MTLRSKKAFKKGGFLFQRDWGLSRLNPLKRNALPNSHNSHNEGWVCETKEGAGISGTGWLMGVCWLSNAEREWTPMLGALFGLQMVFGFGGGGHMGKGWASRKGYYREWELLKYWHNVKQCVNQWHQQAVILCTLDFFARPHFTLRGFLCHLGGKKYFRRENHFEKIFIKPAAPARWDISCAFCSTALVVCCCSLIKLYACKTLAVPYHLRPRVCCWSSF